MSFTFLRSFNEFCRQYILPAGDVDIQPVKESFLAFRSLEHELGVLRDQLARLEEIRDVFAQHAAHHRDRELLRHIECGLRSEAAEEAVAALTAEVARLEEDLAGDNARLAELDRQIAGDEALAKSLQSALTATEDGKLFLHLRESNKRLVPQIERLKEIGRTVADAVASRARNAGRWAMATAGLPVACGAAELRAVEEAAIRLTDAEGEGIRPAVKSLAAAAQSLVRSVEAAARPLMDEERALEREREKLGSLLAALRLGVVPEASVLLAALNEALPRRGGANPARALRELCEVTDENWRAAVEVAFTRKFAVVVDAADFDQAEEIYRSLRNEAPRESLINPRHALELKGEVRPGSLAQKLETSHPVAARLVAHLFGDLMCVKEISELRDHARAILPDGFQYQRPFVERRAHYKNNPCIGKRGLEKQREFLGAQLQEVTIQLQVLEPKLRAVREFLDLSKTGRLESESIHDDLAEVSQLAAKEAELKANIEQMARIRDLGLEEKESGISAAESRLALARAERDGLIGSTRQTLLATRRGELAQAAERASSALDRLRRLQLEGFDLSRHLARNEELRNDLLTERAGRKDLAADLARERFHECDKETLRLRQELTDRRRALALAHPVYAEYDAEAAENAAYDARLARIAEGDVPSYDEKARKEKSNWQHLFRTQVLAKLHAALFEVENLIAVLNQELRTPIGHNRYQIHRRPNPDREMQMYRDLVDASVASGEDDLFFASMDADLRRAVEDIFQKLIDQPASREVMAFLDYRNYHDYDMHVTDTRDPDGRPSSVDRHSGKFSGGENQSPYFIAILACYLRAYHRYERRRRDPSLAIVPIDEAFSKLSGERIRDCIGALKQLDLQGVFSMSSGNIPYALDMCDQMITVMKREQTAGRRHAIRNIPVALTREEALARYGARS